MLGVEFGLIYAIWVIKTIALSEKWKIMENTWEMPQIPIVNKLGSKLTIEATCAMKLCAFNQTIDSLSRNISVIAQIVVIHSSMCIVKDTHPKPPPKQVMKVKFWVLTMKTRVQGNRLWIYLHNKGNSFCFSSSSFENQIHSKDNQCTVISKWTGNQT